jgi:hypothetical protein
VHFVCREIIFLFLILRGRSCHYSSLRNRSLRSTPSSSCFELEKHIGNGQWLTIIGLFQKLKLLLLRANACRMKGNCSYFRFRFIMKYARIREIDSGFFSCGKFKGPRCIQ